MHATMFFYLCHVACLLCSLEFTAVLKQQSKDDRVQWDFTVLFGFNNSLRKMQAAPVEIDPIPLESHDLTASHSGEKSNRQEHAESTR